jgi:hypothetical protein
VPDVLSPGVEQLKREMEQYPPLMPKLKMSGYLSPYTLVRCLIKIRKHIKEQEVLRE